MVGSWRSGKFLPLIQRPYSANTYALSLVWFRSCVVNLRENDFAAINSSIKKWLYADLLFKPEEQILHRQVKNGGLGLVSVKCKSLAFLIKTFLELAIHPSYINSLYLNVLYRFYILHENLPAPSLPPYYNEDFFNTIAEALNNGENILLMTVKQWYEYLVKRNITMEFINQEFVFKPCRAERIQANVHWETVWANVRVSAISNSSKSFAWKLVHDLLPTEKRLSVTSRNTTGSCRFGCVGNPYGDIEHCLFWCQMTNEVGQWLLGIHRQNDPNSKVSSILKMDLCRNAALTVLTIKTLEYCWWRRTANKMALLSECLSNISADLEILDMTKHSHTSSEIRQLLEGYINCEQ